MFSRKCAHKSYIFNMYKLNLALDNTQWLICHKTKLNIRIC